MKAILEFNLSEQKQEMLFIKWKSNVMKLFQRSVGHYIFWVGFIYFWAAMYNLLIDQFTNIFVIQTVWLFITALPLWFKPLARFLNIN